MRVETILLLVFIVVLVLVSLQLIKSAAGVVAGLSPLAIGVLILGAAWWFGYF